jgi:hypothetical protein
LALPLIYSGYGLKFSSDIQFPELMQATGDPVVSVRLGHVPLSLSDPTVDSVFWTCAEGKCLFRVPNLARFSISKEAVTVEMCSGADLAAVRLAFLGPVLGGLLHQRGLLPLHASAVLTRAGAILFSGPVGGGKSTVAAALALRGFPVLADDICAIDASSGPLVIPGAPYLMLWEDSLLRLGLFPSNYSRARSELAKYIYPLGPAFCPDPVPLHTVYFLDDGDSPEIRAFPVTGFGKMELLSINTYRRTLIGSLGLMKVHTDHLNRIAPVCRIVRVQRQRHGFELEPLVDYLEAELMRL